MSFKLIAYLEGFEKEIIREINVNSNINLQMFCENIILSMNGECKHLYQLVVNDSYAYLGPGCEVFDPDVEEMMSDDMTFGHLFLYVGDELLLNYDFRCDYDIRIKVVRAFDNKKFDKDFYVVSGKGLGLIEGEVSFVLRMLINSRKPIPYDINAFDKDKINNKIDNYLLERDSIKPKHYILNIDLEDMDKEFKDMDKKFKRQISIDSDISIHTLCDAVILSVNGKLNDDYKVKIRRNYLEDEDINKDMNYLKLKENQKFKIIYEDKFIFNVRVSKALDNYGLKRCYVVKGKGKIDELSKDDFDLDKVNFNIDNILFSIFNLGEI